VDRRQFLGSSIASALVLTGCGGSSTSATGGTTNSNDEYSQALIIPAELKGTLKDGRVHYDLEIQTGTSNFLSNASTETWGVNGSYLGPTLRLENGSNVSINFTNKLPEKTTMHGHGMHVPAIMDGGAHQVINVGETWSSVYKVNQHACTNWYHPHLMGKTAEHVINGLTGLIIIDDAKSQQLDLPNRYGIDDIPLIVQDRSFNDDGSFDYSPTQREKMHGWKGDTLLANGVIKPFIDVEAKQIRFRILNGSNSRVYNFALKSGKAFKQIATDNSFLEAPVELTQLRLSPAERAEIVIDFTDTLGGNDLFVDLDSGKEVCKINIKSVATKVTDLPQQLTTLAQLNPADAVNTRQFILSGRQGNLTINNKSMDMSVINEVVPVNDIEIWEVKNTMGMVHNFHIHATYFQIIERNGSAASVADNERGYKDTVFLPAGESVKFIVRMTDFTDANSPYMYHCHLLEHEDLGMMGQFTVV